MSRVVVGREAGMVRGAGSWGRILAIVLGAVVVIAGLFVYKVRSEAGPPKVAATGESSAAEVLRLRREVEQMRRESAQLRQLVQGAQSAAPPAEPSEERTSGNDAAAALPPPPVDHTAEYLKFVEGEFSAERIDPTWTPSRELSAKVTQALPEGSRLRAVDCRSSMCRVETSHRDAQSYTGFTKQFAFTGESPPLWTGAAFLKVIRAPAREGEDLIAVAYLGRTSLPVLDP